MGKGKKIGTGIGLAVVVIILIIAFGEFKGVGKVEDVVNQGVGMKAVVVDENGNVKYDLGSEKITFSIVSSPGQTGFQSLSDASCLSGCSFLALSIVLDNIAGDSDITISSMNGNTQCNTGNTNPNCATLPNVLGASTIANTRRGNLNSKFNSLFPLSILKGQSSQVLVTDPMALEEVSVGEVKFIVSVSGTYKDSFGNDNPLEGKMGSVVLKVSDARCSDNTPADTVKTDADAVGFCSTPNKGKYCRTSATGDAVLVDRASLCGCTSGLAAVGEVCKAITGCTPNSCMSGTLNYCKADGQSVEFRCYECSNNGVNAATLCGTDALGQSATGCSPAQGGVSSQCVYPSASGSGFSVNIEGPAFTPLQACGDGVKTSPEDCDTTDFGGVDCTTVIGGYSGGTLLCSSSCGYDTSSCTSAWVKFRTLYQQISNTVNSDEIAFTTSCGSELTKMGEYTSAGGTGTSSQTCQQYMSGYQSGARFEKVMDLGTVITKVTRGTSEATLNPSLWHDKVTTTLYYICADGTPANKPVYTGFKTTVSAPTLSTSPSHEVVGYETTC